MAATLHYTDEPDANALLESDPFALLIGLTIYQQVPTQKAFMGPYVLVERLGGPLDARSVAAMDPDVLEAVFKEPPAIHRFPSNMARRVHAVASHIVEEYDGDAAAVWLDVESADELMKRLKAIPGFGDYKARLTLGVLAENFGVRPDGYEAHMPDWPSVVDVKSPSDLAELSARKKAWKQAKR